MNLAISCQLQLQTRQLNIWGFVRTVPSPSQSASELAAKGNGDEWQHKDFLRGKPHLLQEIARVAIKSAEKQQQRQLPMPKNETNCSLTSSNATNAFTFAFAHTIHNPQAQAQGNRILKRIEPSLSFASTERSRWVAKARVNTVIAAAAAGGTLPVTPYSRTSLSSAFQFLSSYMLDYADCPSTRNCTPNTEQTMEMETEEVEVEVDSANTKGSSTDATRSTRSRRSEEVKVSQLQLQDNTTTNNDDDNDDTNTNDEDWEFKMELDKIFDEDGDDIMPSKACEDDLLSILSLDKDNKLNLSVCEEEVHYSSDFDMVYNSSRCGLLEQNVNLELHS